MVAYHSMLSPSFGLIGKLLGVQLWSDNWDDDVKHQFFQALHNY